MHGPLNPVVNPEVALIDTRQVLHRIEQGEIHPPSPMELSYSIGSALVRREIDLVAALARESGGLEQQVTDEDQDDDPEALLEDLFEVGHQLLAIRPWPRTAPRPIAAWPSGCGHARGRAAVAADLADRFEMVRSIADGQKEFVHGVIEFYQTRTSTHMTIAAESLAQTSVRQNDDMRRITAWVAIIAVPTAVTGSSGRTSPIRASVSGPVSSPPP